MPARALLNGLVRMGCPRPRKRSTVSCAWSSCHGKGVEHKAQLSLCDFRKSLTQIVSIHDRHQLGCGIEAKKEWLDSLDDL